MIGQMDKKYSNHTTLHIFENIQFDNYHTYFESYGMK